MQVRRFPENPIVRPGMDTRMGDNVNGPSLIRVPDWVKRPLGRYYLYFAHHDGRYIRLAYADDLPTLRTRVLAFVDAFDRPAPDLLRYVAEHQRREAARNAPEAVARLAVYTLASVLRSLPNVLAVPRDLDAI